MAQLRNFLEGANKILGATAIRAENEVEIFGTVQNSRQWRGAIRG